MEREDQPDGGAAAQPPSSKSLMEVYLSTLKPLQFGKASLLKFTQYFMYKTIMWCLIGIKFSLYFEFM